MVVPGVNRENQTSIGKPGINISLNQHSGLPLNHIGFVSDYCRGWLGAHG